MESRKKIEKVIKKMARRKAIRCFKDVIFQKELIYLWIFIIIFTIIMYEANILYTIACIIGTIIGLTEIFQQKYFEAKEELKN